MPQFRDSLEEIVQALKLSSHVLAGDLGWGRRRRNRWCGVKPGQLAQHIAQRSISKLGLRQMHELGGVV
jgi:hypothetical protein